MEFLFFVPGSVPRARGNDEGKYGTILVFEEVFCQMDEKDRNEIIWR